MIESKISSDIMKALYVFGRPDMADTFDSDDERTTLEHFSDEQLEQMAWDYGLLQEGESLEDKSTEFVDGLIGDIIEARAHSDSQEAEWNEQQDISEQQRRDEGY